METDRMTERDDLQDLILEAFVIAQRRREPEAAEHLLLALEALDRGVPEERAPRRHLRAAYGSLMTPVSR